MDALPRGHTQRGLPVYVGATWQLRIDLVRKMLRSYKKSQKIYQKLENSINFWKFLVERRRAMLSLY
jgi:hypothetical protein